jgi:hypothetical protein
MSRGRHRESELPRQNGQFKKNLPALAIISSSKGAIQEKFPRFGWKIESHGLREMEPTAVF